MNPNQLPADIVRLLPPPGPDDLSPALLQSMSRAERRKCLKLMPREKTAVMVETLVAITDQIAAKMTPEAWRRCFRQAIRDAVLSGTLPTLRLITAAEHCSGVDLALREILAEGVRVPDDIATALAEYGRRALLRNITKEDDRSAENNINRDIGIIILMTLSMVRWPNLDKSVSHASGKPSHSKLVAAALNRRGVTDVTHHIVVKIFKSYGLIADRLAALIAA